MPPKAVPLGSNKKHFLVHVCGLTCRDNKYFLEKAEGLIAPNAAAAPTSPPPASGEFRSDRPAGFSGDGGEGSGGAGGGGGGGEGSRNWKGELLGLLSKHREPRPVFQTVKLPGVARVWDVCTVFRVCCGEPRECQ